MPDQKQARPCLTDPSGLGSIGLAGALRDPPWRGILADTPVDSLSNKVGVPRVPAVFLDQIAEEPAQVRMAAVGPGDIDRLGRALPCSGLGRAWPEIARPPRPTRNIAVPEYRRTRG